MVQRPKPARPRPPAANHDDSETIQGLRAGLAVFERRRDDVLRVAFSRSVRQEVAGLSRWAGAKGIACHEVSDAELERIAGSGHHEGLCVLARPRPWSGYERAGRPARARRRRGRNLHRPGPREKPLQRRRGPARRRVLRRGRRPPRRARSPPGPSTHGRARGRGWGRERGARPHDRSGRHPRAPARARRRRSWARMVTPGRAPSSTASSAPRCW